VDAAQAAVAPFRFDYLADPFVWHGNAYPRVGGIALYLAELACRSCWAGVAEEAEFRGILLPEMTEALTPLLACIVNGLYFTMVHYDKSMDLGGFMVNALYSFVPTGIYLSYLSCRDDFDFRKAAFAHFWYDFSLGLLYLFYGESVRSASIGDFRTSAAAKGMSFSFGVSLR
jgi:hypothetical protein